MKASVVLAALLLCACKTAAPPAPPIVHDDEAGLRALINLPGTPAKVAWCEEAMGTANPRVPGPNDWQLEAVLVYPTSQRAAVSAAIRARPTVVPVTMPPSSCLPKPTLEGNAGLFGREGRDVSGLARSPLSAGMVAWDGTSGTMFLQAHTM